jgi:2,3-bisphosphoglycerate-dependent phosphoglycerate mutase
VEFIDGALTGKSKAMIANEYGEGQLKKWRRGFKIRPPPVSSYSLSYPGNDFRRIKYVKDLRISWSETFNRSFERRKLEIHRKFPKSESLHDCMERSVSGGVRMFAFFRTVQFLTILNVAYLDSILYGTNHQ